MNYPTWDVPIIGSVWVIGLIAIFHVMISQFAVGGGLYLALAELKARREGRLDWMEVIRRHSKFFLVVTGVFGTVSGVGIWFAIGLASPESTSALIHNFVFGWAMEWCFFLVEIATATVYYYTWDRVDPKTHQNLAWLYAGTSFCTLVIINGILSFMLTPGSAWLSVAGTGQEASRFWQAFFNPTYWPSLALRSLVCSSLAGVWALITASQIEGPALKAEVLRWSTRWLMPSFVLMPLAFLWYLSAVPENSRHLMQSGVSTIGSGLFTQVTRAILVTGMTSATILAIVYFLAWRNPRDFNLGHAISVLFLALAATGATEHAREMIRKPFTVSEYIYSDGVRRSQLAGLNQVGYSTASPWKNAMPEGELMFRGQCMNCHTVDGYRSMRRLMNGRDRKAIGNMLTVLHETPDSSPYKHFMPPLAGTKPEIEALGDYLDNLVNKSPAVVVQYSKVTP
jgi:hypothetical protein